MADYKTLFHNPTALSDSQLSQVKSSIRFNGLLAYSAPIVTAGLYFGITNFALQGKYYCKCLMPVAFAAGFAYNVWAKLYSPNTSTSLSPQVLSAYEHTFLKRAYNTMGYGTDQIQIDDHGGMPDQKAY